jgi:hypothetical protein
MDRLAFARGWVPAADDTHVTPDTLLRADNVVFDPSGAVRARRGSALVYQGGADPVTSIHSIIKDGVKQRLHATLGGRLLVDGVDKNVVFDGDGDVAIASGLAHAFIGRGSTGRKWTGTDLYNWTIQKPLLPCVISANAAIAGTVCTFANGETPAPSVIEGAATGAPTHLAGYDASANGAVQGVPNATGRFTIRKLWAADQDFFTILGNAGDDTDLFDIWVAFDKPEDFESLEIVFGCDSSATDPFRIDAFSFRFEPESPIDVKDKEVAMRRVMDRMQELLHDTSNDAVNDPVPDDFPPVEGIVRGIGMLVPPRGPRTKPRLDAVGASPAWIHFTVPRSAFTRVGNTPGRGWATIRGFQVVYKGKEGSTNKVYLDDMVILGGGYRAYTGTYRMRYRFVRNDGRFLDLGPMSDVSEPITVNQQGLTCTIPEAALTARDPQLTEIWVYIYGGFMGGYYRCAKVGLTGRAPAAMALSEFQLVADGTDVNHDYDRARFIAFTGITIPKSGVVFDISVRVVKGELDVLADNVYLEPGVIPFPNDVIDVAGPYQNRMFVLTRNGGVYPTMRRKPSTFRYWDAISTGCRPGDALWIRHTSGGVYVGTRTDVIRISGTGATNEDGTVDFRVESLGIGTPPAERGAAIAVGSQIFYRAAETIEQFNGVATQTVNRDDIKPLVDGETRYSIPAWDRRVGVRYRMVWHEGFLCVIVPEYDPAAAPAQSSSTLYRTSPSTGRWLRHTYPYSLATLDTEPDGALVAGTAEGGVWLLDDPDTPTDGGTKIELDLRFREDYDNLLMHRKDWEDLHINCQSQSADTFGVELWSNGALLKSASGLTPDLSDTVKVHVWELPPTRSLQLRVYGAVSYGWTLRGYTFHYVLRPAMRYDIDTGYLWEADKPIVGGRRLTFFGQLGADITITPYIQGVKGAPIPVTAILGRMANYRVKLGRALQGRPRFLFTVNQSNGADENGMELAYIDLYVAGDGDDSDRMRVRAYSGGATE